MPVLDKRAESVDISVWKKMGEKKGFLYKFYYNEHVVVDRSTLFLKHS